MFRQHAKGTFTVVVEGPWHCGTNDLPSKKLDYEVVIQYPDAGALDCHGFLIDNLEFKKYFDSILHTADSCEVLAEKCADYFCGLVKERSPHGGTVDVDISVPGLADIDYEEKVSGHGSVARLRGLV